MTKSYIGIVREGKIEVEQPLALPEGSQVRVTLLPLLSEREALGKANIWLAQHIGDAVGALNGALVEIGRRSVWQFEAFITGAHFEPIGPIGRVEVDADTGQVLNPPKSVEAMMARGRELATTS